jgi:hypothetical protein
VQQEDRGGPGRPGRGRGARRRHLAGDGRRLVARGRAPPGRRHVSRVDRLFEASGIETDAFEKKAVEDALRASRNNHSDPVRFEYEIELGEAADADPRSAQEFRSADAAATGARFPVVRLRCARSDRRYKRKRGHTAFETSKV